MVDDLPDRIVLNDPDFLGLAVALLFLEHKWSVFVMVYDWFEVQRPIQNSTDRAQWSLFINGESMSKGHLC